MSERVLIAGCGDLGLRAAHLLRMRGDEVYALRRHPPAPERSGVHWLQADLTYPESLSQLPMTITQLIYAPTPDVRQPDAYRAVFMDGLRNVLGALDKQSLRCVLFVSSSAVYGEHGDAWVDENTPPMPMGFNGELLLEAERWLSQQPICSIVLRLAGLYGPGRLQLVERLREGGLQAPRTRKHWANRIHVDDAAAAIVHLLALREPYALYLGVDETPLPLDALYDHLAALIDAPIVLDGPAPAAIGSKRLSNARLRASGFRLRWPDSREGYAECLKAGGD